VCVHAFQRGAGRGSNGDCDPTGMDRTRPCPATSMPTAIDPAVRAKLEYDQNIKDAARLSQLAAEIKQELENGGQYTLSATTLRKSEDAEKLAKKLHDRMKGDSGSPMASPPDPHQGAKGSGGRSQ